MITVEALRATAASTIGSSQGATEPAIDDPRVLRAVEQYLQEKLAGGRIDRREFLARHGEISVALAECLDGLEFIQAAAPQLCPPADNLLGERSGSDLHAEAPLGDYRLLSEIGRGGMGVVYKAMQISLGREVALKVLPFASALDAKQLQRFKNESQAAAHLHHQNIVPVFGVGCERGVHYYAMQFIDGRTLAEAIAEWRSFQRGGGGGRDSISSEPLSRREDAEQTQIFQSTQPLPEARTANVQKSSGAARPPDAVDTIVQTKAGSSTHHTAAEPAFFRTAAGLIAQAAAGLDHAHQQGVIHRDVKPANLLVDGRGNVWITDFGLAHCRSQAGLTMTGDLVGTLRYMSPEQALAQRVTIDHRTDIYSLGATLYEMLTLQPVFDGGDRQELLRQIAFEEPKSPRKWSKSLPADLETIVLKAMEKNPADRYSTCQELADDLSRFLEDESIRAKRPSPLQRARRWARRHQGIVRTGLASAAILLVTIAVGTSAAAWRLNRARQQATRQLYDARLAQANATRMSRRVGQRFESLKALAEASKIAESLHLPEEYLLERRNAAIAALALPDLRLAKQWPGYPSGSNQVDFDGRLEQYARTDFEGKVSIRRVADDSELAQLPGDGAETWPVFSADGKFISVRSGLSLRVWKLGGPMPVSVVQMSAGEYLGIDFSADSRHCAIGHVDGSISLYDLESGRPPRQLSGSEQMTFLAFHPAGRQLAVACEKSVEIRDLETGLVVAELPHSCASHSLAWSSDGKTLAEFSADGQVYLWDATARKRTVTLEGRRNGGVFMAFSHAGDLLATAAWDGMLRLWDPRTGKELFHAMSPMSVPHFSHDDRLLAGELRDGKLGLWEFAAGREYQTLIRVQAPEWEYYQSSAIRADGRLLAVSMRGGVGLWDLASGKELAFLDSPDSGFVLFEPSGSLLTNGSAGLVRWPIQADPASPEQLHIGPPQSLNLPGAICNVACSRDGGVIAVSQYDGGTVWRPDHPDQPVHLGPHEDARYVAVSPDGQYVATGSHTRWGVKIWEAATGKLLHELPTAGSRVGFSPDGKWLFAPGNRHLWAVGSWKEGPEIEIGGAKAFSFSTDGKLLAVDTGYGAVRLVDPESGREYARLEDPDQDRAGSLNFSPDGAQLVAVTNDNPSIHVWDLRMIRRQLAEMDLDWDLRAYAPALAVDKSNPLRIEVDLGKSPESAGDR